MVKSSDSRIRLGSTRGPSAEVRSGNPVDVLTVCSSNLGFRHKLRICCRSKSTNYSFPQPVIEFVTP